MTAEAVSLQDVAAAAVVDFSERWAQQLATMLVKVECRCEPRGGHTEELEHQPDCPVGIFLQVCRLMREEADEARAKAAGF
jgi:hypothetical protein